MARTQFHCGKNRMGSSAKSKADAVCRLAVHAGNKLGKLAKK